MSSDRPLKVIVLASHRDFGRCRLAASLPTAVWPVAGRPVLERLLLFLADQGIDEVTVCSNGEGMLLAESVKIDGRIELKFVDEPLPAGTAGCIRDVADSEENTLFVVLPASMTRPPAIDILLDLHRRGRSDLTVMFNPGDADGRAMGKTCGIFVCNGRVLEHIPETGYFDIKEGLVAEMLHAGKTVHVAVLPNHVGNFRDRREYLYAVSNFLRTGANSDVGLKSCKRRGSQSVWIAPSAKVDPSARIYEPAAIMEDTCVSAGAVILGPTVLERNVNVGKDSIVAGSVIWDGAQLGANCQVRQCLIGREATVRPSAIVRGESVLPQCDGIVRGPITRILSLSRRAMNTMQSKLQPHARILPNLAGPSQKKLLVSLGAGIMLIAFLWSYWPEFARLRDLWQRSDEYSSGILVPFLAVYVLWTRRQGLLQYEIKPCIWSGLLAFAAAQAFRLFGLFFTYGSAQRLSMILSIAALVLLLSGWRLLRKVSTILLFLVLMVPWPNRIQGAITLPLQSWATSSAVFCLEVAGYDVARQGNVIDIGGTAVAVAEACNGLRMITAFFVISGLVVLLIKRPLWEKVIVFASSLPIALLCNTVRLAITSIAFTVLDGEQWEGVFHDFGGYAMMPLALAAVVAELWLLRKLTTAPTKQETIVIRRQRR